MSTSLITHLRPGVLGSGLPSASKFAGAWFHKQPATIDGVVVDERRGLGTDRPPLARRALTLNGTNQYGWIDIDQVDYPFTMFGFGKKSGAITKSAMSVSDPGNSSRFYSVGFDDGDTVAIQRRNTTDIVNTQAVPLVSGWYSFLFVCLNDTTVLVYRNGSLLHTFSGLTSVPVGTGVTRYAIGSFRSSSPGAYWDGELSHCGFLRRAATLGDAQAFDRTGIISDAEKLLPLDANSTTVSYNIGRSASWWLNDPRRNLLGYSENISQSVWTKIRLNVSGEVCTVSSTNASGSVFTQLSLTTGVTYTASVDMKYNNSRWCAIRIGSNRAWFDIQNGVVGTKQGVGSTSSITNVGGGYYRCSYTVSANSNVFYVYPATDADNTDAGTLNQQTNVNRVQLEVGSTATEYQPVLNSGIEYPEAPLVNAPASYVGRDVPFSRQNKIGYSTRRNLFSFSEQLNNAAWTKSQVTITDATHETLGPTGAYTASKIASTADSSASRCYQSFTGLTAGATYAISMYVKSGSTSTVSILIGNTSESVNSQFNLDTTTGIFSGSVGSYVTTRTATAVSNGWWKVQMLAVIPVGQTTLRLNAFRPTTTGNHTYVDFMQVELGSTFSEPQVIGANPGTTVLFPALLDDPTKSAARDTLEFSGEAHMDGQLEDANCFTFDGVDDYVAINLGDVAGPELVTNGTFASAAGWSQAFGGTFGVSPGNWVVSGGSATVTNASAAWGLQCSPVSLSLAKTYLIEYDLTGDPLLNVRLGDGSSGSNVGVGIGSGTRKRLTARPLLGTSVLIFQTNVGRTTTIDNVSVRELPTTLGATLGSEVVVNGDFASDTVWTKGTGWTISGGVAQHSGAAGSNLFQNSILTFGVLYKVVVTVSGLTGTYSVRLGSATSAVQGLLANGTNTFYLVADGTMLNFRCDVTGTVTLDNVSVKRSGVIPHDGTSLLSYRSQADGFTGTAGKAYNIRFGDVEHIPASEGDGSVLHGTILEQAYSVVNGQASNWETLQNDYHYNIENGFNFAGMLLYLGSPIAYDGEILTYAG